MSLLNDITNQVKACTDCPLHETRTNAVSDFINNGARLTIISMFPSAMEDMSGEGFTGKTAQIITNLLLSASMTIITDEGIVSEINSLESKCINYINLLKCICPAGNEHYELYTFQCYHYIREQLILLKPKVIWVLGEHTLQYLLGWADYNDPKKPFYQPANIKLKDVYEKHGGVLKDRYGVIIPTPFPTEPEFVKDQDRYLSIIYENIIKFYE